ncbi:hypothetical protein [Neptuniibacter sp. CAU 1671]|uniref:hypothetical protein n=1 Tax=Neptuniibacter sp. CAU 1671 TaxID=3032593 RepID=UPI0023DB4A92|nr:hypothetical protein [Neptuniibacter sp. CAU 1671]MDF2182152.1 hypothetical protein [Neptuniibacter sp. CAU 1671]
MNRQDDDLNVPDLGPAETDRNDFSARADYGQLRNSHTHAAGRSGPGWFTTLVLVILVGSVTGLGYVGFGLYQQQQQREVTFAQAQQQIIELRELLKSAEQGAEASGQTLTQRLQKLEAAHAEKTKLYDSEIAKLWTLAHQKNAPKLDEHDKTLAAQDTQLKKITDQLAKQDKGLQGVQTQVAGYSDQLKTLPELKKQQTALQKQMTDKQAEVAQLVARLETQLAATTELLQEQIDQLKSGQKQLANKPDGADKATIAELERRLRLNEQSVRAFDSTRQQLNQELLQVKQKLNTLQLAIESR